MKQLSDKRFFSSPITPLAFLLLLAFCSKPSVNELIQNLKSDDYQVREKAAEALGRLNDPKAVEPLILALQDEDFRVRLASVKALNNLCDSLNGDKIASAFTERLKDPEDVVRRKVARALINIGDLAVKPLIRLLSWGDIEEKLSALRILSEIENNEAVEPIIKLLNDPDIEIRQAARRALTKFDDPRAARALERIRGESEIEVEEEPYEREKRRYQKELNRVRRLLRPRNY